MTSQVSYIDSILNLLYSGERVKITFPSSQARENFRKRLYARKLEQDIALKDLLGEERKVLRFSPMDWLASKEDDLVTKDSFDAETWLVPFKARDFPFEIIERQDASEERENGEEIRTPLVGPSS